MQSHQVILALSGICLLTLQGCGSGSDHILNSNNLQSTHFKANGQDAVESSQMLVNRRMIIVGKSSDGLATPRDLEFNPKKPSELWVVNKDTEGVVIFHDAGTSAQRAEIRKDAYRSHFMSRVSSITFGENMNFASCQESRNEAAGSIDFMGPTLWPSDLNIFAKVNQRFLPNAVCEPIVTAKLGTVQQLLGSHLDMLHQSPLCMGIAHSAGNAFWVFDGANGNLVYYDFVKDHGPGGSDHSDGRLRRYTDVKLKRVAGIPSHIVVDKKTKLLYVADTGTGKILKIDPYSAHSVGRLKPQGEPIAEYLSYAGATVVTFAEGLKQPSGVAISGNTLFVSDYATGEIIVYNLDTGLEQERIATGAKKIMGLTISAAGQLWFVDGGANTVVKIEETNSRKAQKFTLKHASE